jgi:hypothetical protein
MRETLTLHVLQIDGKVVEPSIFTSLVVTDVLSVSMIWSDARQRFLPDTGDAIARGDWALRP